MVSNHPDVVVKVDWENVKPGDAFRLNESVSKDKNGNVTFGHIMLVVDVDLNSKTYTIIEQTSGARKAWDESRKRYKIGTTISTYKIGEKAYTNGSTGKSYTLEDAYTPYKYTGFDK